MPGFTADIVKFAKKTGAAADEQAGATIFKLNSLIVGRTPVDTGQARGGWVAGVGNFPTDEGAADQDGAATIARLNNAAMEALGTIYCLTNNVKHIVPLEYGSSDQAPNGMVRISLKEIKGLIGGS